jgi:hypothetical protein
MRVVANAPIIEVNDSFDGYSYADNKSKKDKRVKKPLFKEDGFFSATKREERKVEREGNRTDRKLTRAMDKKAKKNARQLTSKKDKAGIEKFFYPLSILFKKDGKWKKRERDGSETEVEDKNVLKTSDNVAVDKVEVEKTTGGGAVNWQMALMQGMERLKDAQSKGMLPIAVDEEKVTITDSGAFLNDEVQDKNKPLEDVKKDEKNTLTKTQKYLIWGLGAVAVGIIGYAVYRYATKGKNA